ncbi:MAG: phosphoribosylaminoimidazolesuccinocarboxamide synthase [Oscillospiraceae bacterium]|nr:phosphoribosylaminoimidazolesuccinocarboxamide synthase [Oscillospiraceae bacterium]
MKLIYNGKTKDVYALDNGNYLLKFKDDVTGADGKFDPGANEVALSISGVGREWLRLTEYFFKLIEKAGIPTHYVSSDIDKCEMEVLQAQMYGKGLEFICRFKSTGSFMRRYGLYAKEGMDLDAVVEVTLKDDERGDPLITRQALVALGIISGTDYDTLEKMTRDISILLRDDLKKYGIELYDIKLEFGANNGKLMLVDEVSGGSMRVYKDGKKLEPLEIGKAIFG